MKFSDVIKTLCVCGCVQWSCWGMNRTKSEPSLFAGMDIQTETVWADSDSVTTQGIQRAISKWAHLVPENATTVQVNETLQEAIIHIKSPDCKNKMEALVELICNPDIAKGYAHYVSNVFSSIDFSEYLSDIPFKYCRMLASIGSDRSGGGGTCAALYWQNYYSGFYDPCIPDDEDILKWECFPSFSQEEQTTDPIDV